MNLIKAFKGKNILWYENASLFRIFYMITLSLEMLSIINFFAAILRCFVLAWGMFIFVQNYVYKKEIFKVDYFGIILSYIFCSLITIFLNFNENFLANLVMVYHCTICFFIFYGMSTANNFDEILKEMIFLSRYFFWFATFSSIISLFIVIFKIQFNINFLGEINFFGIVQKRLIGFYTNSNLLAFMMVTSLISSDILKIEYVKNDKFKTFVLLLGNILNVLSLFLSDSNASFFFIIVYFTVKFFCNNLLLKKNNSKNYKINNFVLTVIYGIIIILCAVFIKRFCQLGFNYIIQFISPKKFIFNDTKKIAYSERSIGRKNYDIDSGRFTLWSQGIEIWKHRPFFGIGRENLVYYGKKFLSNGIIFPDLHNGYLTILVSNGIIGFVIFLIFAVFVAKYMFKVLFCFNYFFDKKSDESIRYAKIYSVFFSMICAYGVYSFFERTLFSGQTFMVVYFWLILGYTFTYIKQAELKKLNSSEVLK